MSRYHLLARFYLLWIVFNSLAISPSFSQAPGHGISQEVFDQAIETDAPVLHALVPKLDRPPPAQSKNDPSGTNLSGNSDRSEKIAKTNAASQTNSQNGSSSFLPEIQPVAPLRGTQSTTPNGSTITAPTEGSNPSGAPQQNKSAMPPPASEEPPRRSLPAPMDAVFPLTEWVGGPLIGVPDTDPTWPLEKAIWAAFPVLKKNRIKIYGWVDPSYNASTSKHSNVPLSYNIVPNRLELDQLIGRIERVPDTVQREHYDWGFRYSGLFGIDYRYTAASGYGPSDGQLLRHNDLYGYDYPEAYALIYEPHFAKGMITKIGRYISPPDIEAQLAPDNYLFTHSLMFTYDAYTHTGVQQTIKLSDQWMVQGGIHAGTDTAPWARAAHPTMELFARWVSKSNRDSIYGGVDSFNGGSYKFQKDNLQQFNLTWGHKISRRINTMTEGYYLYTFDALKGGTVSNGPVKGFGGGGGPGAPLPGYSQAFGLLNYTNIKITDHDYITVRPVDYLFDPRGWRTGYATTYSSWTIGFIHRFSDLLCIRPEVRYERALTGSVTPYDNGTRRSQFTFSVDVIQRF